MAAQHFLDDFRRFFIRGLGALVPTLLTVGIVFWAFRLINDNVGNYVTEGLLRLCALVRDEPAPGFLEPEIDALRYGTPTDQWDDKGRRLTIEWRIIESYERLEEKKAELKASILANARRAKNRALWELAFRKYRLDLLGFLIAIILVYFMGFFLASFLGRTFWRATENLLSRIPLVRAIYPNIKQVTDFLLTERPMEFSGVVAVQYPRKGAWSLALSTGEPLKQLQARVADELVTVFIPSSPTPMTGYVVQVPREDVVELNLTIDEGLRFTISGGVIKPGALVSRRALEENGG